MENQYDNVSEKTRKIEIALKFAGGSMEKAKLMAAGKLLDVVAIKGKFVIPEENLSGAFLVFINIAQEYIAAIESVMTANTSVYSKIRIFDDWKSLYKNIHAYETGSDVADSGKLKENMMEALIKQDVFPDVQKMNLEFLSLSLQEILKGIFGSDQLKSQVDLEKTNSMELELTGVDIMVPESLTVQETEAAQETKKVPETAFRKKLGDIESRASYIVEGCCVLSPVRGKSIGEVTTGERILVSLTSGDMVSERIIDAYKARDHEGKPLPVVGRIVEIVPNEEGKGVILYVLVAKGIFAKIIEEENVRIQTEMTKVAAENGEAEEEAVGSRGWVTILISVLFVILIIALILILILIS